MTKPVPFFSACPACSQKQLQLAYTRRALLKSLESGDIIDAYCLTCDLVWPISQQDRESVAAAVAAGPPGAPPTPRGNDSPRPISPGTPSTSDH
jgi:hypothetical protein